MIDRIGCSSSTGQRHLVADYRCLIGSDLHPSVSSNFTGRSDANYSANGDPGRVQKAFGLLGGNIDIGAADSRWRGGAFAITMLDKRLADQKNLGLRATPNPAAIRDITSPDAVRTVRLTLDFRL